MVKIPARLTSERRDQVWLLMLKDRDPQSIKRELNLTNPTLYRDIQYLQKKSKQFVYDMARGTHVLMYQRAIEGIRLVLSECWDRCNGPS